MEHCNVSPGPFSPLLLGVISLISLKLVLIKCTIKTQARRQRKKNQITMGLAVTTQILNACKGPESLLACRTNSITPTTATTPNINQRTKEGSSGFLDTVDF
jgi:hypothetical protein